ncbi:uncharacterized protein LOC119765296 [Culex quinquefasciatus]|uniref:uncharacterized protein LOC119765296 n=1 Tax=Culex quinquefasciatus TaxID=7176 RepID=UPI0018E30FCF|nr:uncharacterized protein LOC119765296 [Culex quinquefasciatus]
MVLHSGRAAAYREFSIGLHRTTTPSLRPTQPHGSSRTLTKSGPNTQAGGRLSSTHCTSAGWFEADEGFDRFAACSINTFRFHKRTREHMPQSVRQEESPSLCSLM